MFANVVLNIINIFGGKKLKNFVYSRYAFINFDTIYWEVTIEAIKAKFWHREAVY